LQKLWGLNKKWPGCMNFRNYFPMEKIHRRSPQ
jgi:hypothetical protein